MAHTSCAQAEEYPPALEGFVVVQSLSCVWLFATPWAVACQAPLSSTISWSLLRFMSIESVVLSNLRKGLLAKLHRTYPRGRHYLTSWNWSKVYYLGILLRRETFSVLLSVRKQICPLTWKATLSLAYKAVCSNILGKTEVCGNTTENPHPHNKFTSHIMHLCMLSRFSRVRLFATPWTVAHQASLSMGSSRQEC